MLQTCPSGLYRRRMPFPPDWLMLIWVAFSFPIVQRFLESGD